MQKRRLATNLLKLLAAILASLLVLELGIRLLAPMDHFSFIPNTYDPVVGIRQVPNARGFLSCPEYDIEIRINAQGLRDRDYPYGKPAGVRRILCLGDSFTNGFGVHREETFATLLEQALGGSPGAADAADVIDAWEVLNAGVAATGTAQQLAYFEHEGYRYEPDHVVLAVSPNDFVDNAISGLYTRNDAGRLIKHRAPRSRTLKLLRFTRYLPGYTTLFARSHLLNTIKMRFATRHHGNLEAASRSGADERAASRRNVELTQALITRLDAACDERYCRLTVMIIPPLPGSGLVEREMDELVNQVLESGIPCLDLRADFAALSERGIVTNYPYDGHWNATGHHAAADRLVEFFRGSHGTR